MLVTSILPLPQLDHLDDNSIVLRGDCGSWEVRVDQEKLLRKKSKER